MGGGGEQKADTEIKVWTKKMEKPQGSQKWQKKGDGDKENKLCSFSLPSPPHGGVKCLAFLTTRCQEKMEGKNREAL